MDQIHAFFLYDADKSAPVLVEREWGFGACGYAEELAAQGFQLLFHPAAFARHQRTAAFGFQCFDDFERRTLRATCIQLRYDLQDSEAGLNQRR